jgi:pimeloyl-ACP methyl ester carboxylesterase
MKKELLTGDKKLQYSVTGNGSPVVLVHGFAEDSSIWDAQVTYLQPYFKLIVPDLPGSGGSNYQPDARLEDYADFINAMLEAENIGQCIMIGHSMGGYITLAFAERYPAKLSAFGLFHSSAYADDDAKIETRRKGIDFIKKNGGHEFLKTAIPGLFADPGNTGWPATLIEKGKAFSDAALVQYYEAMIARPDRTDILGSFNGPVLFIMGEYDKAVPFEHSLRQSHIPARSHIHILRHSAHMGMLEETGEVNDALKSFLYVS